MHSFLWNNILIKSLFSRTFFREPVCYLDQISFKISSPLSLNCCNRNKNKYECRLPFRFWSKPLRPVSCKCHYLTRRCNAPLRNLSELTKIWFTTDKNVKISRWVWKIAHFERSSDFRLKITSRRESNYLVKFRKVEREIDITFNFNN